MKLNYYADTDSLYIDLSSNISYKSKEVSEGIVIDYDYDGKIVGIDIDNASKKLDLNDITLTGLPFQNQKKELQKSQ